MIEFHPYVIVEDQVVVCAEAMKNARLCMCSKLAPLSTST